jgi:hypothetical protein
MSFSTRCCMTANNRLQRTVRKRPAAEPERWAP